MDSSSESTLRGVDIGAMGSVDESEFGGRRESYLASG
jgi:hypothetical protein